MSSSEVIAPLNSTEAIFVSESTLILAMPFILFTALFWILVIPIPMTVYLILKRLEKKQLSRLIIAKILGIDS